MTYINNVALDLVYEKRHWTSTVYYSNFVFISKFIGNDFISKHIIELHECAGEMNAWIYIIHTITSAAKLCKTDPSFLLGQQLRLALA